MNRQYLKNIGLLSEDLPDTVYTKEGNMDKRANKYKKHLEKTGVNTVDTWNLDTTAMMWLYERLIEYKAEASKIVDLTYYKFNIDGEELTQKEAINLLIELAEAILAQPDNLNKNSNNYKKLMTNKLLIKKLNIKNHKEFIRDLKTSKDWTGDIGASVFESQCEKRFWNIWSIIYATMWW